MRILDRLRRPCRDRRMLREVPRPSARPRVRSRGMAADLPLAGGGRLRSAGPRHPCRGRERPDLRGGAGGADPDPRQRGGAPGPLPGPRFPESSPACCGWRAGPPERGVPPRVRGETVFLRELHEGPGRRDRGRPLPRLRRRRERGRPRERGGDPDHPPAVWEPQRGAARLRPRQQPLHRHGGRGLGRGSPEQRSEPRYSPGKAPPDRRGVGRGALRDSSDQPVPGQWPVTARRSGRWGCGTRGGSPSTAGRGTSTSATWDRGTSRRSTSSRPGILGAGTTAGTSWRATVATLPGPSAATAPALPSRSSCTITRSGAP